MKIVYESLKQFKEVSDPIKDMHIGMDIAIKNWVNNETGFAYKEDDILWICAVGGKADFVKYLLTKGYNDSQKSDAFYMACDGGHIDVVKVLLDAGTNIHSYDDVGLQIASKNGHVELVKFLLDEGANVHANNNTPIQLAYENSHHDVVKLLQNHINKENKIIKESMGDFREDSDPVRDMGIGLRPTKEDIMRVQKIYDIPDATTRWETAKKYIKLINDKDKAFRRYLAAKEIAGKIDAITQRYLTRAATLGSEEAIQIYDKTHKIPFETIKTFFKDYRS